MVTLTFQMKEAEPNSPSPVRPQSVPSLSPVCPQLEQVYEKNAKVILDELRTGNLAISQLMGKVGEKNKNRFRQNLLNPLIEAELIEPTIKDKPNSSKQAYRLTSKAMEWMNKNGLH